MQQRIPPPSTQPNIPPPPTRHAQPPTRKAAPVKKRITKKSRRKKSSHTLTWIILGAIFMFSVCSAAVLGGGIMLSAGRVMPNVSSMGVNLGMMTESQAATTLNNAMQTITLQDGNRIWNVATSELGILLDINATAKRAANVGFDALLTPITVQPVVSVNSDTLTNTLNTLINQIELPARNAGIRLINGDIQPVPAQTGRQLDIAATVATVSANPAAVLADGKLELTMRDIQPPVTDASPLVEQARRLLSSPLRIQAYNPFEDETISWIAQPDEWANWLTAEDDPASSIGIRLSINPTDLETFLNTKASSTLQAHQYINIADAVPTIRNAITNFDTTPIVQIHEQDRTHTVQSGETITSIAWDYGIPYPYIQQANPTVTTLNAGTRLTIPSREAFLEYPIVPNKRVVVSISGNWTKVYENGSLKWDWVSSTGINSSPTWTGIYQIISHEENAYAGNWNLYMPWFMGVYKPIPGSGFTNGFHGFPTRGGGQILWENNLGTKVTYGCILLSNTNVKSLYDWAENGVIVEILP